MSIGVVCVAGFMLIRCVIAWCAEVMFSDVFSDKTHFDVINLA